MTHRRAFIARATGAVTASAVLCFALCAPAGAQAPPPLPPPTGGLPSSFTQLPSATGGTASAADATKDCAACGVIESIKQTTEKQNWTPLGMGVGVGGAPPSGLGDAPGAVSSFQIGPGFSNQGLVLLGAAGGSSYRKSPNSYDKPRWEVTVKLDGGGVRLVNLAYEPYVREGDRVRVSGNNVELLD
jgi:hypothetical protein